ncbi:hypothetical protein ACFL2Z_01990 [Candidatus Eisenbacteria bacterium]|uniref:Uncharacterized protein n=1 Tax=Eiseniibacteriota bacterium TaxID=2212470 RepID=A0ABV6YNM6_UNCEI
MRTLVIAVVLLLVAGWAFAQSPSEMRLGEQVEAPPPPDYEFYCQQVDPSLYTVNASSPFASWVVDDIPDEFAGMNIVDIVFYVGEWGAAWTDPSGVYVDFYFSECPPGLTPDAPYYFAWSELATEIIYDDPGYYRVVRCKGYFAVPVPIQEEMSIAFQVDTDWGVVAPYAGITMADPTILFGDCEAYRDGPEWGYPRWTSWYPDDVAYCLSDGAGGDPSMEFLTCISDCDETMYKFNITAGGAPVNDMELCIYDADTGEAVDIEMCSVPLDWTCGHNGGPHCAYYQTTEHTLAPGETHGPFDFVTAGGVHQVLEVIWTFTYNGNVVAGPETTYFMCGASETEPRSWGAVKALYK